MRIKNFLTDKERSIIQDLESLEAWIDNERSEPAFKAKSLTCLAHDWLDLKMEDRAFKVLIKAHKICPNYFSTQFVQDSREDSTFALIAVRIASHLIGLEVETSGVFQ